MNKFTSNLLKSLLLGGVVVTTSLSAVAYDDIDESVYEHTRYASISEHLRSELTRLGYDVINIDADDYNNQPALEVDAKKTIKPMSLNIVFLS